MGDLHLIVHSTFEFLWRYPYPAFLGVGIFNFSIFWKFWLFTSHEFQIFQIIPIPFCIQLRHFFNIVSLNGFGMVLWSPLSHIGAK